MTRTNQNPPLEWWVYDSDYPEDVSFKVRSEAKAIEIADTLNAEAGRERFVYLSFGEYERPSWRDTD